MRGKLLIGVDIGTQGVKGSLFRVDGKCLASSFRPSQLLHPQTGVTEEDPEYQVAGVCDVIRDCMKKSPASSGAVAAVAIDGQMAGVLGVGSDGRALTPYDSWLDTRCAPQIEQMKSKAGKGIIRKTGGPASFNHGPKILWWKQERPSVYRKITAFVQPGGYAAMRLCGLNGQQAFIDASYLHFSGFADNRRLKWDAALCETFSVDPIKLPQIIPSHQIVGKISATMAKRCGLSSGVPVVAGCGDTTASFLACGATREGVCVDVAGTASVFSATTKRYCPDVKFQTLSYGRSVIPGLWHPYAYINGGGLNLEWFRKQLLGEAKLKDLDRLAEQIGSSEDEPLFIPHLSGRVSPSQPDLRGAWVGLSRSHEAANLYRAILESVALEYGIYRDVLRQLDEGFAIKEIRVTGGGECSQAWNRIKAAVLGCPVVRMNRGEGAPMGAALLAGYGVGLFPDLDLTAQQWSRPSQPHRPLRGEIAISKRRLERYKKLLDQLNPLSLS